MQAIKLFRLHISKSRLSLTSEAVMRPNSGLGKDNKSSKNQNNSW